MKHAIDRVALMLRAKERLRDLCVDHDLPEDGSDLRVSTHCLYPSATTVVVRVSPTKDGKILVTDDASGLIEIRAFGLEHQKPGMHLAEAARRLGVSYRAGEVYAQIEDVSHLPAAVMLVANASKEGVHAMWLGFRPSDRPSFEFTFDEFIRTRLANRFSAADLAGKSGKLHRFKYVNRRGNLSEFGIEQVSLIVAPVTPSAVVIAMRTQAHGDLQRLNVPTLRQRFVIDPEKDEWSSADRALLEASGIPVVEMAGAEQEIHRLAA